MQKSQGQRSKRSSTDWMGSDQPRSTLLTRAASDSLLVMLVFGLVDPPPVEAADGERVYSDVVYAVLSLNAHQRPSYPFQASKLRLKRPPSRRELRHSTDSPSGRKGTGPRTPSSDEAPVFAFSCLPDPSPRDMSFSFCLPACSPALNSQLMKYLLSLCRRSYFPPSPDFDTRHIITRHPYDNRTERPMKIEIVVDPSRPAPPASLAARVAPAAAAAVASWRFNALRNAGKLLLSCTSD